VIDSKEHKLKRSVWWRIVRCVMRSALWGAALVGGLCFLLLMAYAVLPAVMAPLPFLIFVPQNIVNAIVGAHSRGDSLIVAILVDCLIGSIAAALIRLFWETYAKK
jgi:hypothetical protein